MDSTTSYFKVEDFYPLDEILSRKSAKNWYGRYISKHSINLMLPLHMRDDGLEHETYYDSSVFNIADLDILKLCMSLLLWTKNLSSEMRYLLFHAIDYDVALHSDIPDRNIKGMRDAYFVLNTEWSQEANIGAIMYLLKYCPRESSIVVRIINALIKGMLTENDEWFTTDKTFGSKHSQVRQLKLGFNIGHVRFQSFISAICQ